jgi:hypothetical protein
MAPSIIYLYLKRVNLTYTYISYWQAPVRADDGPGEGERYSSSMLYICGLGAWRRRPALIDAAEEAL